MKRFLCLVLSLFLVGFCFADPKNEAYLTEELEVPVEFNNLGYATMERMYWTGYRDAMERCEFMEEYTIYNYKLDNPLIQNIKRLSWAYTEGYKDGLIQIIKDKNNTIDQLEAENDRLNGVPTINRATPYPYVY